MVGGVYCDRSSTCMKEMPPTDEWVFVHEMPVNNKWEVASQPIGGDGRGQKAIDISVVYHMVYDSYATL